MTTKELIKQLQEADPEGNMHVRTDGGAVVYVDPKPGYWDGAYAYIENGKYVISTQGSKVDIITSDSDDWIMDHDGDYSDIIIDTTYVNNDRTKNEYLEKFKQSSVEFVGFHYKGLYKDMLPKLLKKLDKGWKIYQDKDKPIGRYNSMYFKKGLKTERLMQGEMCLLLESGKFIINKNRWTLAKEGDTPYQNNRGKKFWELYNQYKEEGLIKKDEIHQDTSSNIS